FVETEQRRGQLVEQRIRDAEEGRAKSEGARRDVQDALNEALAGHAVPEAVLKLLQDGWSDLMVLQHLKHGAQSPEWNQALNLARDLIWSVCPPTERTTRRRLVQLIPGLLKGLREGLTTTSMSPFEMDRLLKELEAIHLDVLQRLLSAAKPVSGDAEPAATATVTATTVARAPTADIATPPTAEPAPQQALKAAVAASPAQAAVVQTAHHSSIGDEAAAPVASAVEAGEVSSSIHLLEVEEEPADVIDERYLDRVDSLHAGCWVEFFEEDGKKFRAKLVAVIKTTGKYIFVNRAGVKVSEKTRLGLAAALRDGKINPLDDGLLFDRALESVIGNLRGTKRA